MTMNNNEKKFELSLNKTEKVLKANVSGTFRPEDANDFLEEYMYNIKNIDPKDFHLSFDCRKLNVAGKDLKTNTDMSQLLKACIEQYKKDGFKKITVDCKGNLITKMQISRLAKEVDIPNFIIEY